MNTQDILRHGRTRFDLTLDFSEYYDYELVENILGKVDAVLDYSEYYDYTLGDNILDYIYYETFVIAGNYIQTEDEYIIITEDNYLLEYTE
jgi:hypothetical protein